MTVAVLGEAIADMLPTNKGEFRPAIGGSPFNFARATASLGTDTYYLSPVSSDALGTKVLKEAESKGIRYNPQNRSNLPTSLALVTIEHGHPVYSLYRSGIADLDFDVQSVVAAIPDSTSVFHTGSLMLVPDKIDDIIAIVTAVKKLNITVCVDVNLRPNVVKNHKRYIERILALLPLVDVIKASDEDLEYLGFSPHALTQTIMQQMPDSLVVLTRGAKGAEAICSGASYFESAKNVNEFVDVIGAGDSFFGAFISYLHSQSSDLNDWTQQYCLKAALQWGSLAAGINVSRAGCQPASAEEIVKLM